MPCLVEIGPVVLEKKIFLNFVNVFSLFGYYLPSDSGEEDENVKSLWTDGRIDRQMTDNR